MVVGAREGRGCSGPRCLRVVVGTGGHFSSVMGFLSLGGGKGLPSYIVP